MKNFIVYNVQLELVKILAESKIIESKREIHCEIPNDELLPMASIKLSDIFGLPRHCPNCDIELHNDDTLVLLIPVAHCIKELPDGREKHHMLCITKIICDGCETSYLVTSHETIGEQLKKKFTDGDWERHFIAGALDDYIAEIRTPADFDVWKEYLYELTYMSVISTYDARTYIHDDSEWDHLAIHED